MTVDDPLTEQIIGCCYRVANELGYGFFAKVYENGAAHAQVCPEPGWETRRDGIG